MKFGIAVFPSKKLQDLANSYRKRYDPHYSLIPPHLTLKEPFEATDEEINKIAKKLNDVAKNAEPFTLRAYKISSFQPVNNVIYMKVDSVPELTNLYQSLQSVEFGDESPYSFVPHITVAQKLSDDEHSDVYGSLRMAGVDHEETVDRFHLLYQLENGSWTVYETYRLGGVS
ncbi:YjcG family protein [Jeotgalibacillus terrae]|uniref:Putative phosphoesterase ACFS5P_05350 n=1 Tax=Jeotgalibacillus terrae TaxID=587735 RepID=A0ABW5ZFC7_9BACL|nr:YjcG family protein [Jeotgalibacillus terrae]MBM7578260.1 2'-5' RNA ligase [Jeotgalibacillus terrae]